MIGLFAAFVAGAWASSPWAPRGAGDAGGDRFDDAPGDCWPCDALFPVHGADDGVVGVPLSPGNGATFTAGAREARA